MRPSNKLDYKKLRHYEIDKKLSLVNFRLKLLRNMRIHSVFHVLLLEPVLLNALLILMVEIRLED